MKTTMASSCLAALVAAMPVWAYEELTVTDGAGVEGKVVYRGDLPTRKIIPTKDREVCGAPREEAEVLVGPDQGVQDAVVYLKAVPRGKPWGKADKIPVLDNKNCRFEPAIQVVRPGSIDIHNSDPVLHNTHGFYGRRTAFNVALPDKGVTVRGDVPRPGLVRVECDAHGWMLAHVYVADSPYYALTGKDGSFAIKDVPPGSYTLVVAQRYLGDTEMPVTAKGGETTRLAVELKKK